MVSNRFFIGGQSYTESFAVTVNTQATNDGELIFDACKRVLNEHWRGQGIYSIQVTAIEPFTDVGQADLFTAQENNEVNKAIDAINVKFGKNMVRKGLMMDDLKTPDVISPAWKPSGHRQTIG